MPRLLIIPAAVGVGLGLASSFLFFPQSTSHTVLMSMEGLVSLSKRPLDYTHMRLMGGEDLTIEELRRLRSKIIGTYKGMEPALAFLPLDFSVGRWNPDDVKSLTRHIRQTMVSSLALLEFHIARVRSQVREQRLAAASGVDGDKSVEADEKGPHQAGRRQIMEHMEIVQAFQHPESETLRSGTVETLRASSSDILPACKEAMTAAVECIHTANSRRWFGRPSREQDEQLIANCRNILANLVSVRSSFAGQTTERLLQRHSDIFDESGDLKQEGAFAHHSVRGIMTGLIYQDHVVGLALALEELLSHLTSLLEHRQGKTVWFPRSIRYAAAWLFRREIAAPIPGQSTDVDPEVAESESKEAQQRLRFSRGSKNKRRSGLGRAILGTYHWFINPEGLYALRMVVLTIALAIPAVIPSSSGFYYRAKGVWALMMGQTAMVVYMADFTFSVISRFIGTVVGGAVGLVAWYIGSGHGPGNPYGLGAIMAAVVIILMWARLFLPRASLQASILAAATCILVVGYSYDDT